VQSEKTPALLLLLGADRKRALCPPAVPQQQSSFARQLLAHKSGNFDQFEFLAMSAKKATRLVKQVASFLSA
jgi:hypothetical protein